MQFRDEENASSVNPAQSAQFHALVNRHQEVSFKCHNLAETCGQSVSEGTCIPVGTLGRLGEINTSTGFQCDQPPVIDASGRIRHSLGVTALD